ncbi:hypothetical protein BC828DRAFT_378240 [Blastocladiella britannica]|nr:hypothetical protein BC828DRAFT_378240 [Blastocladiella britannica]
MADTSGLSAQLPELNMYPRDCTAVGSCNNMTENAAIGFTRQIAGESANAEVDRFINEATLLVNTMTLDDPAVTSSAFNMGMGDPMYMRYRLIQALGADILSRVYTISTAMVSLILSQVDSLSAWMQVAFAAQVALVVGAVAVFVRVALRRVRIEGRTLTAMLYLIPENVMAKDAPRIAKFLESGGLIVDLSGLVIGGGEGKTKS